MDENQMPGTAYPGDWGKRARLIAFIAIVSFWLITAVLFLPLLNITLVSLLIVYGLYFPIRLLVRRTSLKYHSSAIVSYVLFLIVSIWCLLHVGPTLFNSLHQFGAAVAQLVEDTMEFLRTYTPDQGWLVDDDGAKIVNLNFILEPLSEAIKIRQSPIDVAYITASIAARLLGVAGSFVNVIALTIGVLTLTFYIIIELPMSFEWLRKLPTENRREVAIFLKRSMSIWNRYALGVLIVSLVGGVATFVQLAIMGIGDALFLSVLSTFIYLIPIFGGFIAPFLVAIGAFLNGSSWIDLPPMELALLSWLIFIVVQGGFINSVITPKIFGKVVNFPVTIVIFGLVIFTAIGGLAGALLAVPAMGILREGYFFLSRKVHGGDPYPSESEPAFLSVGVFASREPDQESKL